MEDFLTNMAEAVRADWRAVLCEVSAEVSAVAADFRCFFRSRMQRHTCPELQLEFVRAARAVIAEVLDEWVSFVSLNFNRPTSSNTLHPLRVR